MKKQVKVMIAGVSLGIGLMLAIGISGCATANPNAGKPVIDPITGQTNGTQPAYLPNQAVTKAIAAAGVANDALAPVTGPYAPIISGILALATTITGLFAYQKNSQANAATAQNAIMAQGIVKAGPSAIQTVNDVAASTQHYAAIANHINEANP